MFDRLIESDSSDQNPRRRYFVISSIVVGALFLSAVVVSLYAADIGLGNDMYELTALLPPVQPPAEAPEPPQPQRQRTIDSHPASDLPVRVIKQQPIDQTPVGIPPISRIQNRYISLPDGLYEIGKHDSQQGIIADSNENGNSSSSAAETRDNSQTRATPVERDPPPPPVVDKPQPPQSIGVVNGIATSLPKPPYPPPALAMRIEGKVDVQVTIDESGKVISARAASGHPLLKQAAESAAWKAHFTPTLLSRVPVKVTGVIVYNFTRN